MEPKVLLLLVKARNGDEGSTMGGETGSGKVDTISFQEMLLRAPVHHLNGSCRIAIQEGGQIGVDQIAAADIAKTSRIIRG